MSGSVDGVLHRLSAQGGCSSNGVTGWEFCSQESNDVVVIGEGAGAENKKLTL